MKTTIVCIFVCLLMILTTVVPMSATTSLEKISHPQKMGNVLYVGGLGPNNYTKIQDAINDATNGDTVFVYDDSSPYFEAVQIDRSISLLGEGKLTTIIDVSTIKNHSALSISSDGVVVQGFTVQNSTDTDWTNTAAGIFIKANHVLIKDTIIKDNNCGIRIGGRVNFTLYSANHCRVEENDIYNNDAGISLENGNYSTISQNTIASNVQGIDLQNCHSNLISLNKIAENSGDGIFLSETTNNTILLNNITENEGGMFLFDSNKNSIQQNNIFNNEILNVGIFNILFIFLRTKSYPFENSWDGNYWGQAFQFPKPIVGYLFFLFPSLIFSLFLQPLKLLSLLTGNGSAYVIPLGIPSIKFDWHPAQTPYDILVKD
ncbi:MAG TPA: NosD domain-containing protein [Candidatus Thermoplasmatota archaeon]|nr:NosD domain-containing protein [Candidatus Thermoplasmatota archaeon]